MRKSDVKVGRLYVAKISGVLSVVKVSGKHLVKKNWWFALNLRTNKSIIIKSATKLRLDITDTVLHYFSLSETTLGIVEPR